MESVSFLDGVPSVFGKRKRSVNLPLSSSLFRKSPVLLSILMLVLQSIVNKSVPSTTAFHGAVGGLVPENHHRFLLHHRRSRTILEATPSDNNHHQQSNRIRLNKVFKKTHSRREADRLIEEGRVSVNGERVATKGGFFVVPYVDEVSLDGKIVEGWEEMNYIDNDSISKKAINKNPSQHKACTTNQRNNTTNNTSKPKFEYIKYWKPRGVICTTDTNIPGNIIDEMRIHDGYDPPVRVYPVGRLDKETTGIILLTSDGRLPNAALRKQHKRPKVYEVRVNPPIGPPESRKAQDTLEQLRNGVVISTETVRNGVRKTLKAPTEPCKVEQINDQWIRITLREGRNRQVRKMTQAVGHRTVELERVSFAGIPLEPGLRGPGDWDYLRGNELEIVRDMIRVAVDAQAAEGAYWESDSD